MKTKKGVKITYAKMLVVLFAIVMAITPTGLILMNFNDTKYTVTITDKERTHSDDEKYLVFGEDPDGNVMVFENTDNLLRGKWDSSNFQGELRIGKTYEVTVIGYRVPLFSWYENIIDIKEIS